MKTYRVTTIQKTVYVHNVEAVETECLDDNLVFRRVSAPPVCFPLANVISYEATA